MSVGDLVQTYLPFVVIHPQDEAAAELVDLVVCDFESEAYMDELDQAFTEDLWENADGISGGNAVTTRKRRFSGAVSEASANIFPTARAARRSFSRGEYRI